jgi:hypothetical protein
MDVKSKKSMHALRKIWLYLLVLPGVILSAQEIPVDLEPSPEELIGEWQIDLRPTPDAEPYFQIFAVEEASKSNLVGTFYGSPLQDAYVNSEWPELYFAFTTSDGTHAYYHSAYLKEGKLYGTSYCPGRAFIAKWTGEKKLK